MEEKEKVVFLSGQKVNLRPRDKQTDLEKCLVWFNDAEITRYLTIRFPVTRLQEEEWFERKKENDVGLGITTKEGLLIGGIGLHNIDYLNGRTEIGIIIGDKNYWSRGFGFDAEMMILNYAFNELNLRKITHSAYCLNIKSVKLARKCGGVKEGILRKHTFKDGGYLDMVIFAIFKNRWCKAWENYIPIGGAH